MANDFDGVLRLTDLRRMIGLAVSLAVAAWTLHRFLAGRRAAAPSADGTVTLRYGSTLWVLGAFVMASGLYGGAELAWAARSSVDRWMGLVFGTAFSLFGGWSLVGGLWGRVEVSAAGVREHTLGGGVRELAWADVRRVELSTYFLTLHGANGRVRAHEDMLGFNDLVIAVEANVPEEIWAQAWPAPPRVSQ